MADEADDVARERGSSPGRPTAFDAARIEARLFTAGWDVLAKVSPDKLSFSQVARQARASKKTLYARWSDKRQFMLAMLEHRLATHFHDLSEIAGNSQPQARLARLAEDAFRILSSNAGRDLERLIDWLDATADSQQAWAARRAIFSRVLGWTRILLTDQLAGIAENQQAGLIHLWIDGIIGRTRTDPRPEPSALSSWADAYSGFFLLAVDSLRSRPRGE